MHEKPKFNPNEYTHEELWVMCERITKKKKDKYNAREQLEVLQALKREKRREGNEQKTL